MVHSMRGETKVAKPSPPSPRPPLPFIPRGAASDRLNNSIGSSTLFILMSVCISCVKHIVARVQFLSCIFHFRFSVRSSCRVSSSILLFLFPLLLIMLFAPSPLFLHRPVTIIVYRRFYRNCNLKKYNEKRGSISTFVVLRHIIGPFILICIRKAMSTNFILLS